ncbi:hypothetical protein N806_32295 [Rhodococcus sp. P27]|nr:hypothetical protein N806_32295 [Rhodococcus sp. P27]
MTMTAGTTVLDIQNVDLTFPDGQSRVTALDDVSLRLHRGEIAAITGLRVRVSPACWRWRRH